MTLALILIGSVNIVFVAHGQEEEQSQTSCPKCQSSEPGPSNILPDLTGIYSDNNGGTFYVRQNGDTVWWVGMSQDSGHTWTTVFMGKIQANKISGEWADVPLGSHSGVGKLSLEVKDNLGAVSLNRIGNEDANGGFSQSVLNKKK